MSDKECGTCRWWVKPENPRANDGECHGAPPALKPSASGVGSTGTDWIWPKTRRTDWCGQHTAKD